MWAIIAKIPEFLRNRTARNIYFWLFFYVTKVIRPHELSDGLFYGLNLFNLLCFIIPCVLNNYVLVPFLLRRKKYLWYGILFFSVVSGVSFTYTLWMKYLMIRFPGIDIFSISVLSPDFTAVLTLPSVLEEMTSIFYVVMLLMLALTAAQYFTDSAKTERRAEEAEKKRLETELNFLKNQVNPHFLFNTLNNLYGLALKKSDDAPEAILGLSSVLRYVLYESNAALVSFEKEKEIMQAYIDIEMLRFNDTANLQFSIISSQPRNIPPLLWLPLLENVFKHGTHQLSETGFIDFRFILEEHALTVSSKNSYDPRAHKTNPAKREGIGLNNLRKRLEILYPGRHSVSTEAGPGEVYTVNVQITWE
jgi:sensor histidine kinase YesM